MRTFTAHPMKKIELSLRIFTNSELTPVMATYALSSPGRFEKCPFHRLITNLYNGEVGWIGGGMGSVWGAMVEIEIRFSFCKIFEEVTWSDRD